MVNKPSAAEVFVGREDVLEWLEARLNDLMQGNGRVVFVAGEAGIGKTALVKYFLNSLSPLSESKRKRSRPSICLLQAECNTIRGSGNPYAPFAELLDGLSKAGREGFLEKLIEGIKKWSPKLVEGLVPHVGPLFAGILEQRLGVQGKRPETVAASGQANQFWRLFEQLSRSSPLLLFIDDLHWADEASTNLIFALARRVADVPILLIGTYRPHHIVEKLDSPAHPLSRMLPELHRYGCLREVALDRFTPGEVRNFLDGRFPQNSFPPSFAETLHEQTNGIPFFLDQVVWLLIEREDIFLDQGGRWAVKSLDVAPIPKKVREVVEIRVGNLGRGSRRLLGYASVLGQQFRSLVLAQILKRDYLDVLDTLETLQRKHNLVRERVEAAQSEYSPDWEFQHAYVHQALYESLAVSKRTVLHSRVVDALESHFPDARGDLAAELAHHCESAERYQDAVPYRLVAASRVFASRVFRWGSVSELVFHCERGISDIRQLKPSPARSRDEVFFHIALVRAYRRVMDADKVERVAHELLRLVNQYSDLMAEIEGWLGLLYVAALQGDRDGVRRYSTQAWNAARRSKIANYLVRAAGFHVREVHRFHSEKLKQRLDETIDFCRREKARASLARAIQRKGEVAFLENEYEQALSLFTEATKVAELIEDSDEEFLYQDHAFVHAFVAVSCIPEDIVTACIEYIGRIHRRRGEWQQAIREFSRVYERKEAEKNLPGMSGLLNVIAETQLRAGATENAERSLEQSWAIAQQTEAFDLMAMVLSTGISIALELENDAESEKRLHLFEEMTPDWSAGWVWHKKQMTRGVLDMRAGVTEEVASLLTAGLKAAQEEGDLGLITQYGMRLAELNLLTGKLNPAAHYADLALQTAREHNLWDLGAACLVSARAQVRAGRIDEAQSLVELAIEHFQDKKLPHKVTLAQDFQREAGLA